MAGRMVSADEAQALFRRGLFGESLDLAHTVVELTAQLDAEKARADAAEAKVRAALEACERPSGIWPFGITRAIAALTTPEAQS